MGKLQITGKTWTVKPEHSGDGSWYSYTGREIGVDYHSGGEHFAHQGLIHELVELLLNEAGCRYITRSSSDPTFVMTHREYATFARMLADVLLDNGLISEKKIRKLIEEK